MADDTKQRLLLATIACIERKGLHAVTSRDIAKEAKANIAAVNYHFGSKTTLVELSLQLTVDNAMEDFAAALLGAEASFRDRLHSFLVLVLAGGARFPNIGRAHLYNTIIRGEEPGIFVRHLTALMGQALENADPDELPLGGIETARRLEIVLRAALMKTIGPTMIQVDPPGAASVDDEARRLVGFILP